MMYLKISGVTTEQLFELHKTLKSEKVRGTMPIDRPTSNPHPEQINSPVHARLLRNKMSEENGSYTLELGISVDAEPSRVHSSNLYKRVMVSRKVVNTIFDTLDIFPEDEQLAPSLNLLCDESEREGFSR